MEDVIRKSRTDCVYFLASPLTCKKGSECEYRHSEKVRFNPRECWYWLNGGDCLNPTCRFRHPPLEELSKPVSVPVSSSKSNISCYFYFNSYCIKGDQCPFLHVALPAQKFQKAASKPTAVQPPESKSYTGSDSGPASLLVQANPSAGILKRIPQGHSREVEPQAHDVSMEEGSPSSGSSVPESMEAANKFSESPLSLPPVEYSRDGTSEQLSQDQSSEESLKESVEPNEPYERLESSLGFDDLVDGESDQLADQVEAGYLLTKELDPENYPGSHMLHYRFEGPAAYDPKYFRGDSELPRVRERFLDPASHRKRKLSQRERESNGRGHADREMVRNTMIHGTYRSRGGIRGRHVRRRMSPLFHSRSGIRFNSIHSEPGFARDPHRGRSLFRAQHYDEREKKRRGSKPTPALSSEFLKGPAPKASRSARDRSAVFAGPKTLAQIRDEKSRAQARGRRQHRNLKGLASKDFEGPKPLKELLKSKRGDGPTSTVSKQDLREFIASKPGKGAGNGEDGVLDYLVNYEKQVIGYEIDSLDDDNDDDDEDSFQKKLEPILYK